MRFYFTKLFLGFSVLFFFNLNFLQAQSEHKKKSIKITAGNFSDSLYMGGYLDGLNTFTEQNYFNHLRDTVFRAFEPMVSVKITNKGNLSVIAPRLTFNNKSNWFDLKSIIEDINVRDSFSNKEKIILISEFLKRNTIHFSPSNLDSYNNLNMLIHNGYGTCDQKSWIALFIAKAMGLDMDIHLMPHHTITHFNNDDDNFLIDSDFDAFYLNIENNDLTGKSEIINDKYLIARTKHYGKNTAYDKEKDLWVSRIYYPENLNSNGKETIVRSLSHAHEDLNYDFMLKPGESILYEWKNAEYFNHDWYGDKNIPEAFRKYIIANGKYSLQTDFNDSGLEELFLHYKGVEKSIKNGSPRLVATENHSEFIIKMQSPFPILDISLSSLIYFSSPDDSVEILYSTDNANYVKKKSMQGEGIVRNSFSLNDALLHTVPGQTLPMVYDYYLKFILHIADSTKTLGIDSLSIENIFQVSRSFMPSLVLGNNLIRYTDKSPETDRNIKVEITWQESIENKPPLPPAKPVFPINNQIVDSLYFLFEWEPAIDPDGDIISDYEFFLSSRSDMLYPLSPNFNLYTSILGEKILSSFKVKETGWLNDGATYYWKVRAKDNRGAWGNWSEIWSFTPKGVMRPINTKLITDQDKITISWSKSNVGKSPHFYKIYASNETNGFYPEALNFITKTADTFINVYFNETKNPNTFYRIVACTDDGQQSTPSDVIELSRPYLFHYMESIVVNQKLKMNLLTNKRISPYFYFGDSIYSEKSTITINLIPEWLQYNKRVVTGYADYNILRKINYDDSLAMIKVKLTYSDTISELNTIILESPIKNRKPSLFMSNNDFLPNKPYTGYISTDDGDNLYGDYHSFEIISKPEWLDYRIENDTVHLFGATDTFTTSENKIVITATDSKYEKTTRTFQINWVKEIEMPIELFPNPLDDYGILKLKNESDAEFNFIISDLNGQIIHRSDKKCYTGGIHEFPLDVSNIKPGFYLLTAKILDLKNGKWSTHTLKFIRK